MQTYEKLAYEADSSQIFQGILESSKALREALASLSNAPTTNCNLLITGETGTGKELVARVIHRWSHRSPGAFVRLNCATIQPQLIASELFGPRKGSHSPKTQPRLDCLPLAEGGTIFLQAIDDLVPEAQIGLLRVLEDMKPVSTGRNRSPRLIASTRHDLQAATNAGTFLRGLFDLLNEVSITLPPLRDQTEDIPALARYFLNCYFRTCRSAKQENRLPDLSESAMDLRGPIPGRATCTSYKTSWSGSPSSLNPGCSTSTPHGFPGNPSPRPSWQRQGPGCRYPTRWNCSTLP